MRGWALATEGQAEEGIRQINQGLERYRATGAGFQLPHLLTPLQRLRGELLLAQAPDDPAEAEACFHNALDIARRQHAKSLELRTATSLARLWQRQGKGGDARQLLNNVFAWFTEGFDTVDLRDARTLLNQLGAMEEVGISGVLAAE